MSIGHLKGSLRSVESSIASLRRRHGKKKTAWTPEVRERFDRKRAICVKLRMLIDRNERRIFEQ